jgi:hypothetical protein
MDLRRVFDRTQVKRDPIVIERDWTHDDALAVLLGGPGNVARIREELDRRPELLEAPLADLLRELLAVPGIGRAVALRYVAAELYRASV